MCMSISWSEAELRVALNAYEVELRQAGKARNTVHTYVQHPERFINWLVGSYRPRPAVAARKGPASKYDPLRHRLEAERAEALLLRFSDVEALIGSPLPASARRHRTWWANETAGTHGHARSWLAAGWRTRHVDMKAESVEFVR